MCYSDTTLPAIDEEWFEEWLRDASEHQLSRSPTTATSVAQDGRQKVAPKSIDQVRLRSAGNDRHDRYLQQKTHHVQETNRVDASNSEEITSVMMLTRYCQIDGCGRKLPWDSLNNRKFCRFPCRKPETHSKVSRKRLPRSASSVTHTEKSTASIPLGIIRRTSTPASTTATERSLSSHTSRQADHQRLRHDRAVKALVWRSNAPDMCFTSDRICQRCHDLLPAGCPDARHLCIDIATCNARVNRMAARR